MQLFAEGVAEGVVELVVELVVEVRVELVVVVVVFLAETRAGMANRATATNDERMMKRRTRGGGVL